MASAKWAGRSAIHVITITIQTLADGGAALPLIPLAPRPPCHPPQRLAPLPPCSQPPPPSPLLPFLPVALHDAPDVPVRGRPWPVVAIHPRAAQRRCRGCAGRREHPSATPVPLPPLPPPATAAAAAAAVACRAPRVVRPPFVFAAEAACRQPLDGGVVAAQPLATVVALRAARRLVSVRSACSRCRLLCVAALISVGTYAAVPPSSTCVVCWWVTANCHHDRPRVAPVLELVAQYVAPHCAHGRQFTHARLLIMRLPSPMYRSLPRRAARAV